MIRLTKKVISLLNDKQKRLVVVLAFMMLIGAILESFGVSLILPLVSAMSSETGWDSTWYAKAICSIFNLTTQRQYIITLLIGIISIFIIKNVYLFFERFVQFTFIAKSRLRTQKMLMHRYVHIPYEYYLNSSSGEVIRIITSDTTQAYNVLTGILTFYTEVFVCFVLAVTLIIMSPAMSTFFVVLLLIEVVLISKVIRPYMGKIGWYDRFYAAETNKWMVGLINGIKSIKVANTGSYFESMYSKNANLSINAQRKNQTFGSLPKLFIETFSIAAVLSYVLIVVISGSPLSDIVPLLSVFAIAAIRLLPSVNSISNTLNSLSYNEGGLDNIIKVLNEKTPEEKRSEKLENLNTVIKFDDSICLNKVSFNYANVEDSVIEDASLKIQPGQSVGIVGKSGAGKTTTVDILLGLLKPKQGEVLVDGVNIEENMGSWLSHLAYIPQQIFLMDDSIRANVAFGIPSEQISDEQVWKSLEDAQLKEFVEGLPNKLDTKIGDRGVRISGGQGQRLGIARALYNNPELLIFDEATSSLDNETEKAIMQSINGLKGRKTMIIIAHRLTTIENCDVVYKVEDKKLVKVR